MHIGVYCRLCACFVSDAGSLFVSHTGEFFFFCVYISGLFFCFFMLVFVSYTYYVCFLCM